MAQPQGAFYRSLGRRIKAARMGASLTQEALATAVGLTRTSITNIEHGRQPVLAHMLVTFSHALGIEVGALLPQETTVSVDLNNHLQNVASEHRSWVKQILAAAEENIDAPTISEGKKKGSRVDRNAKDHIGAGQPSKSGVPSRSHSTGKPLSG